MRAKADFPHNACLARRLGKGTGIRWCKARVRRKPPCSALVGFPANKSVESRKKMVQLLRESITSHEKSWDEEPGERHQSRDCEPGCGWRKDLICQETRDGS